MDNLRQRNFVILVAAGLTLNSCKENTIAATITIGPGMTMNTKIKCASNWENSEIYDGFAEKYVKPRELAQFPLSLQHIKNSVEKVCGLK